MILHVVVQKTISPLHRSHDYFNDPTKRSKTRLRNCRASGNGPRTIELKGSTPQQRTARCFHATTQGSITLRRKLFLEPDLKLEGRLFNSHETSHGSVKRPSCKPENNRLLLRAFPGCYPTITLVIMSDSTGVRAGHDTSSPDADSGERKRRNEHWSWDVCISFPADDKPSVPEAVEYPEASWRQMYLCQPPCADLYLVRRWQKGLKPAIIRDGGIKMGDFVEEATKAVPECDGRTW